MMYEPLVILLLATPEKPLLLTPPADTPITKAIPKLTQGVKRVLKKQGVSDTIGVNVKYLDGYLQVQLTRKADNILETFKVVQKPNQDMEVQDGSSQ